MTVRTTRRSGGSQGRGGFGGLGEPGRPAAGSMKCLHGRQSCDGASNGVAESGMCPVERPVGDSEVPAGPPSA